ncbi:MAG: acetyl/propionyl/methylcrotonyl-CoA carboxylase subunit alpha [Alphaproteobacteria bacterium]|nr:acetyl/propionyl/methylcrotonyl-CoA carboxylase subunit alpha [Alphaproteobacteria bacterium]
MKKTKTIQKVLIANRGEIACRVVRTCTELGIETVAVYSDADAQALHVEMASEAVHIGPAAARESYLCADKVLAVAKETGADAVHPGYGFLSENADFAEACAKAGLAFIGPPASAIRAMGGKSAAKALMERAGVPLVPGYHGDKQDEKTLSAAAEKIGFPVLIKASAGGGGKGMRIVETAGEFSQALAAAKREAKASFGDEHVLVEKYLANPRHVEIQVFADTHGNCVYLFERDCSVQRRHQKVIEEAPAPGMKAAIREKMGKAAVAAAQAIDYVGAGTVEFLLDGDDFYFMEMNTRLQVEHPVTEMITGLDLVELQIRVAEGAKLPFAQKDLKISGHAFEARLYAEDPQNNFLPGAGHLAYLAFPPESDDVRIDTGVRNGDDISIHYDPMIAKIIAHGETREQALENLAKALDATQVAGPKSNLVFLRRLARHNAFAKGDVSTKFIDAHRDALVPPVGAASDDTLVIATLALLRRRRMIDDIDAGADWASPWADISGWRVGGGAEETFTFSDDAGRYIVRADTSDIEAPVLHLPSGKVVAARFDALCYGPDFDYTVDGRFYTAATVFSGNRMNVMGYGLYADLVWHDPLHVEEEDAGGAGRLTAPMPGKVVAVSVEAGAAVKKGQPLVIVEAMKMEHTIVAPFDGTVGAVHVSVGEQVDEKKQLVQFEDVA